MAPKKRTGTDLVQTPAKKKVRKEPDTGEKLPGHGSTCPKLALIAKFDEIAEDKGCTQWLMDRIDKQGKAEYLAYYDATYPPEKGVGYLTERDLNALKQTDGGGPRAVFGCHSLRCTPCLGMLALWRPPPCARSFCMCRTKGFSQTVTSSRALRSSPVGP